MSSRLPIRFCLHDAPPGRMRDPVAEAAILARMGRGDAAALPELWEAWSRPLFAVAMHALGNQEDAEEVLQDALVKFWRKAAEFDAALSQPFTWGMMLLRGLIQDRLRARRRRPVLVGGDSALDHASCSEPSGGTSDLLEALASLSPEERQALDVAVFQPGTHEEIARRMGQPLGTVKGRIRRALEKLHAALTEDLL
ncbi:MAG: polymerase subunit sigma-70 [Verrucomicrobiales bacterium]|nr:polymerase subunit sigma-70 [Verrucomicrobiales bacterium]